MAAPLIDTFHLLYPHVRNEISIILERFTFKLILIPECHRYQSIIFFYLMETTDYSYSQVNKEQTYSEIDFAGQSCSREVALHLVMSEGFKGLT